MENCEHNWTESDKCPLCLLKETTVSESPSVTGYAHSPIGEMHKEFERIISSSLNWPIKRTGSRYHDEKTAGAWLVFRRGEGV